MIEDNGDPLNPASAAYHPEYPDGAQLIAEERERQTRRWSIENDDQHVGGELAVCAELIAGDVSCEINPGYRAKRWPEERAMRVRTKYGDDLVRRLTIAGALIAAEIDRLMRAGAHAG